MSFHSRPTWAFTMGRLGLPLWANSGLPVGLHGLPRRGRFGLPLWADLGFHSDRPGLPLWAHLGFYCRPAWASTVGRLTVARLGLPQWADRGFQNGRFGLHSGPTWAFHMGRRGLPMWADLCFRADLASNVGRHGLTVCQPGLP
ncbi:hypothetical protein SDJN03_19305, partial [Cucurbita argyrosperma subsp. sororia]